MAAEFASSAAANTVGNLATEYASPYLSYFFRFGKIVADFKSQRKALELRNDRVKKDVAAAIKQNMEIAMDVNEWLTSATKELGEAQSLEEEIERNKCFNWCSSCGWRYCLSKKVAKKTLIISKLLETSNFASMGHRPSFQGIEFLLPSDFMRSKSSKNALDGIMKALNCDDVNMIGLYGMPGVGKTTLATEAGKQAKQQGLFNKVVIVTMSQNPNISNIQQKIAEILGLNFEKDTKEGKAEELWWRLKGEKKILIIVDDIWKKIDLQAIGIPFGGEHAGCKILLTTRRQQVCNQMNCEPNFELNILSEDEAWALFKDTAGLNDASSAMNEIARKVARECMGLPLAIVTIANTLKGESLDDWEEANQLLKNSKPLDNQDDSDGIYSRLKLSYDYLKEETVQSCFLLCSLFPEDEEISIEMLTMFGIGQGLFSDIDLIEDGRRATRVALRKLQKSGLLLETNKKQRVKMHDVVRDFAHWLTSKGENKFMVKDGLTKWPMIGSFEYYTAIALWNSNINDFPSKLEFSKLKTLFLDGKSLLLEGKNFCRVPNTFFEEMKALQVLFLKNVSLPPEGLQSLTNLRTLCLWRCEVKNLSSSLRNMTNLEILVLIYTALPEELVELPRLKYFFHNEETKFAPNLLSRLTSLQELHVGRNNVNLLELNSLSHLTALSLRVSTDQCFQENFVFPKRYNILVNRDQDRDSDIVFMHGLTNRLTGEITFRTLKFNGHLSSLSAFKNLFCNVEKLNLENVSFWKQKNIVPMLAQDLLYLQELYISCWNELEQIIDFTPGQKVVVLTENQAPSFSNLARLKTLDIKCCSKLTYLFSTPVARTLVHLEKLILYWCHSLEHLIIEAENEGEICVSDMQNHYSLCWPKLKILQIINCQSLKYIFPITLAQGLPYLESVEVEGCPQLMQVFHMPKEKDGHDIVLPQLKFLKLENLKNFE